MSPYVRIFHVFAIGALYGLAIGQDGSKPFAEVRPDITIVVRQHGTGANIVEVTVLNPKYPADLLSRQMESIGTYTGSEVNGLRVFQNQIDPENKSLTFLKSTCGTFGLWDSAISVPRLEPLVKAFAGAPAPFTIHGISVLFEGVGATEATLRKTDNKSVSLEAVATRDPPSVEYRIGLLTQDPDQIVIPTGRPEPSPESKASENRAGLPGFVWAAIGIAGLAAGVLVYLWLLRGRRPAA